MEAMRGTCNANWNFAFNHSMQFIQDKDLRIILPFRRTRNLLCCAVRHTPKRLSSTVTQHACHVRGTLCSYAAPAYPTQIEIHRKFSMDRASSVSKFIEIQARWNSWKASIVVDHGSKQLNGCVAHVNASFLQKCCGFLWSCVFAKDAIQRDRWLFSLGSNPIAMRTEHTYTAGNGNPTCNSTLEHTQPWIVRTFEHQQNPTESQSANHTDKLFQFSTDRTANAQLNFLV